MKVYLQRYGVAGFLLVYWSLSFVNEYFLHEHPLSAESWKWMLQVLLVPSVWLFYQWQWSGLFLLQWQGAVFLFCLFALPVSTFCFS